MSEGRTLLRKSIVAGAIHDDAAGIIACVEVLYSPRHDLSGEKILEGNRAHHVTAPILLAHAVYQHGDSRWNLDLVQQVVENFRCLHHRIARGAIALSIEHRKTVVR